MGTGAGGIGSSHHSTRGNYAVGRIGVVKRKRTMAKNKLVKQLEQAIRKLLQARQIAIEQETPHIRSMLADMIMRLDICIVENGDSND